MDSPGLKGAGMTCSTLRTVLNLFAIATEIIRQVGWAYAALAIPRHGVIDERGIGQVQFRHDVAEALQRYRFTESGIALLFLGDGRDSSTAVVMAGIDQGVVWQREQLVSNAVKQVVGAAVLKVSPTAAVDEQCITAEQAISEEIGKVPVCVPGGMQGCELQAADDERDTFFDAHIRAGQLVDSRPRDTAAGLLLQLQRGGDVVGMYMGVQGERQLQVQPGQLGQVAVRCGNDRVDEHGLAGVLAPEYVGISGRHGLEQLAKYHDGLG